MNIYVETNFLLELVFEQEQCVSCEQILQLCSAGQTKLIIPAYSLAEPHEKLNRQAKSRRNLQQLLDAELKQLSRTASYISRIRSIQDIASLMVQSNEEERQRFIYYREQLFNIAEVIALTSEILIQAASCESTYDLSPQDAIVYASVMNHLRQYKPQLGCFLNRNSKDFDSPDIVEQLNQLKCRMIPRFDHGYNFIQSQLLT
ncbi:PIN domain-containing protein (plasmid) [Nostoc sp. UHCC 0302]|uniref:PIN domain-containing protein n=1 Tax=Nostoc sp. UHCC 0302 TaxID=3134896 RepID=UPI00311CB712